MPFIEKAIHNGKYVLIRHEGQFTRDEFEKLLKERFKDVQFLAIKDEVHDGTKTNLLFAIAKKED